MNRPVFFPFFCIAFSVVAAAPLQAETVKKDDLVSVVARFEGRPVGSFRDFLETVRQQKAHPALTRAVARFVAGGALEGDDRINLYRLLGAHTRLKDEKALIRTLGDLVAIPTVKQENVPQHESPAIRRFGKAVGNIAAGFGLGFRNVDDRVFEVVLPGQGAGEIGVFTHGDVVPFNPAKWVLPDGRRLDPLKLTVIGDRMYGRGARDDKGSIVAVLFALGAIKRSGLTMKRTIRLMIETTEETGGAGVEYYKERHKLPPYNVVLDGRYPVGVAEKGFGVVRAKFPVRKGEGEGAEIVAITGGRALNQIPGEARAVMTAPDAAAVRKALDRAASAYVAANGGNFRVETAVDGNKVMLTVHGEATHSARPERGVNPVSRLFGVLHAARKAVKFKRNHFTDAASYVAENWGLDYYGRKMGIDYADPFMGPLTVAVTYTKVKDGVFHLVVNPRAPRGKEPEQLIGEMRRGLGLWQKRTGIDVAFDIKLKRYMFRDPKGPWIATLLNVFHGVTGIKAGPRASSGYTTARQLPNGVQFGPGVPGEKSTAHKANEFKKRGNFLRDVQIVTETLLRLGNLERME